jgi:hypothetical protein
MSQYQQVQQEAHHDGYQEGFASRDGEVEALTKRIAVYEAAMADPRAYLAAKGWKGNLEDYWTDPTDDSRYAYLYTTGNALPVQVQRDLDALKPKVADGADDLPF